MKRAYLDPFDPRAQPLTPWPTDPNATPGSYEDYSDQRPGLSRSARRGQRRPKPFVPDELGYTPTGTWVPTSGGAR